LSTVLVTGAGGFVGSAVVRRLVGRGTILWDGSPVERVVALVRPSGSKNRLELVSAATACSVEQADVYDEAGFGSMLSRIRPHAVIHTALDAAVHTRSTVGHRPLETLFAQLAALGGARLVHAGSAWVLAPGVGLDESAAVDPRSSYAGHKAAEDKLLPVLGRRYGVDWVNLRLFNIFGRYERSSRLLPHLVARLSQGRAAAVSHGSQLRDFNDVDDVAEAFALALQAPEEACGRIYHIGSGRATTVREFAQTIAEVAGDPQLIRFGAGATADQELEALVADPALAQRVLGWTPAESLRTRLHAAAEWWLERLVLAKPPEHEELHR
jgi:polyisoprenyl-phosphate glycosyltransferase